MSENQVVSAIDRLRAAIQRGEVSSITLVPEAFREMDELDVAAIQQFMQEDE